MNKFKKIQKPKCKRCDSSMVYLRLSKNERVCRECGYVEKLEEKC